MTESIFELMLGELFEKASQSNCRLSGLALNRVINQTLTSFPYGVVTVVADVHVGSSARPRKGKKH